MRAVAVRRILGSLAAAPCDFSGFFANHDFGAHARAFSSMGSIAKGLFIGESATAPRLLFSLIALEDKGFLLWYSWFERHMNSCGG